MSKILLAVKGFIADDKGATAIEYGLIVVLVGVATVVAVKTLGTQISDTFTTLAAIMASV